MSDIYCSKQRSNDDIEKTEARLYADVERELQNVREVLRASTLNFWYRKFALNCL